MVFINTFISKFLECIYPTSMYMYFNIGYRDSNIVVQAYSIINMLVYYWGSIIYDRYTDILISKNIFYSFTDTNCKIRIKFSLFISILDIIYILFYSIYKRCMYGKEFEQERSR